jgi:hypothetical protein
MSEHDTLRGSGPHDESAVPFRAIALLALALIVIVVIVSISMRFVFDALDPLENDARQLAHPLAVESTPPPPNLQAQPQLDLAEFQARQAAILSSYGWVDRRAGIVRIPIERAMDLVAERGLPVHK